MYALPFNTEDECNKNLDGSSTKRRVRFEEENTGRSKTVQRVIDYPELHFGNDIWLNEKERSLIRVSVETCVGLLRDECEIDWSQLDHLSYQETLQQIYSSCIRGDVIPRILLQELKYWTHIGHSRRGLEKLVLPKGLRSDLRRRKRKVYESVIYTQEQCDEVQLDFDRMSHLLAMASQKFSAHSRRIAEVHAVADYYAAYPEIAEKLESEQSTTGTFQNKKHGNHTTYSTTAA